MLALASGAILAWRAIPAAALRDPIAAWPWAWLCLLVPGDWLHYVVPEDLAGLETFLASADRRGPAEELHGLSIEPVESFGLVGIVVREAAASRPTQVSPPRAPGR